MHEDVRSECYDLVVPVNTSFSVVNLLALPQLSDSCIPRLEDFLTHQYPTVRFLLLCSQYMRAYAGLITSDSCGNSAIPLSLPSEQGHREGHR